MIQVVNDNILNSPNPIIYLSDIEILSKKYENLRMGKCLLIGNGSHEIYHLICIKKNLQYTSLERALKSMKKLIIKRGIYFLSIPYNDDLNFMRFLYILNGIFSDTEVYFTVYKNTVNKITISCFGHRPSGLWGYDLKDERYKILFNRLKQELINIMDKHKSKQFHIISGVAQGTEQLFCVAALRLKQQYPIHLECVIPCIGYESNWPLDSQKRYNQIISACNQRTYLDKHFKYYCLDKKNQYICKRSDYIIAHYINDNDGVKDAIAYAKSLDKKLIYIK